MAVARARLTTLVEDRLQERNELSRRFFAGEAQKLSLACRGMAERFLNGGRLLAFGVGGYVTDAQHISVEFVHPVIVGKRALPALDLSAAYESWVPAVARAGDVVVGFGPPEGDSGVARVLARAAEAGAMIFAFPGEEGDYALTAPTSHPFIYQEIVEVLYHTLWETVHVFFEHRESGHDVGRAGFLYPFLGRERQETGGVVQQVAASIRAKAEEDERLRAEAAAGVAEAISAAAGAIRARLDRGGKVIVFGNGGSATDANDFAFDCIRPPFGWEPAPAISLSQESAVVSAVANDIGADAVFLRQLIAHARPEDVAVAITTSGNSANIVAVMDEAQRRGLETVALLGYDGGEVVRRRLANHPLVVKSDHIPRIQEIHASIYHIIRELMEVLRREQA